MESLIDSNTAAMVVTNPSNPCGSVFSREHLKEIVALAEKYHLPIIADEIYAWMVSPIVSASMAKSLRSMRYVAYT